MKVTIEIDGATAAELPDGQSVSVAGETPSSALAPPAHVAAKAAALGAQNAGPAPTLAQSAADAIAPATHTAPAVAPPTSSDHSAGPAPG